MQACMPGGKKPRTAAARVAAALAAAPAAALGGPHADLALVELAERGEHGAAGAVAARHAVQPVARWGRCPYVRPSGRGGLEGLRR